MGWKLYPQMWYGLTKEEGEKYTRMVKKNLSEPRRLHHTQEIPETPKEVPKEEILQRNKKNTHLEYLS